MTSLEDVHEVYNKKLYLENFNFIDSLLASYITTRLPGEPLWLFPIAPSSFGKTEQLKPWIELSKEKNNKYNILLLDQLTAKAFASGRSEAKDIGAKLSGRYTFIIIPDLASILSTSIEERTQLFAMFRTLYDKYIVRDTGTEKKSYFDCHVNMFACSTPLIQNNIEFLSQMGTREILYDVKKIENPLEMCSRNITNEDSKEMIDIVKSFIDELLPSLEFLEPDNLICNFIKNTAEYICKWRVEPTIDERGLLTQKVIPEYPPRLFKQLKKLYMGLIAIGLDKRKAINILKEIEHGSGNRLRREVYQSLYSYNHKTDEIIDYPQKVKQIANKINRSPQAIITQLMILRDLKMVDLVDKENDFVYEVESIWRIVHEDELEYEKMISPVL